jgi:hypothetical protein
MLGDPKECRLRARQCLLMANRAASPQEQRTFERIHRSWNRLAVEIESAQALMATSRATELAKSLAPNPGDVTQEFEKKGARPLTCSLTQD